MEPGNGTQEEQASFTGITVNGDGTTTLTGVSTVSFIYPYTETSGLAKSHPGGVAAVISNTSGFYNRFANKDDDETITGLYTFPNDASTPQLGTVYAAPTLDLQAASKKYVDSVAVSGAPNANETTKGIVQEATQAQVDAKTAAGSTGADLFPTPAKLRSSKLNDITADTGAADAYVLTPTIPITAYANGQMFTFIPTHANSTTTPTVAVSGLAATVITKNGGHAVNAGDLNTDTPITIMYQSTANRFMIVSTNSRPQVSQDSQEVYGATATGNDSYAINPTPVVTALVTGVHYYVKLDVGNTGAASLSVSGIAAKTIKKNITDDLDTGDLVAGSIIQVAYDGTNFQLISPLPQTKRTIITATRDIASSNATVNYAHGLGVAPRWVRVTALLDGARQSFGEWVGGTNRCVDINTNVSTAEVDNTNCINITTNGSTSQVGTITVDATNIMVAWVKAGSPATALIALLFESGT